jgi:DNA-directed RNA polymerase subunit RPC12/RpoP
MQEEILREIKSLYIDCPECTGFTDDEQYTCTTCWCQGGDGRINVFDYIKEHPDVLK